MMRLEEKVPWPSWRQVQDPRSVKGQNPKDAETEEAKSDKPEQEEPTKKKN
jgi:hypothetical protein